MSKTGFSVFLLCLSITLTLPPVSLRADSPRAPEISANSAVQPPTPVVSPVDQGDIIDIYGPIPLPEAPPYLLYTIFALLLLMILVGAVFLYRWWQKKKTPQAADPADLALRALSDAELKIAESGNAVFVTEISSILRSYIEQSYNIRATRQTTREFFATIHQSIASVSTPIHNHTELLKPCLSLCDMVKFAHLHPADNDAEKLSKNVRSFIETTRLKPETEV